MYAAVRLLSNTDVQFVEATNPYRKEAYTYGAGIGFVSGIIGVGGGIFLSPILLLKRWATPKSAAATAAMFIWVNSAAGLFGAAASNQLVIEPSILLPFLFSVFIGGLIGSRYGALCESKNSTIFTGLCSSSCIRQKNFRSRDVNFQP